MPQLQEPGPERPDNSPAGVSGLPAEPRHCTCERGRQDGYTAVESADGDVDWVCGACRRPTRLYLQNVIEPRDRERAAARQAREWPLGLLPTGTYGVRVVDAHEQVGRSGPYVHLNVEVTSPTRYAGRSLWDVVMLSPRTLRQFLDRSLAYGVPAAEVRALTDDMDDAHSTVFFDAVARARIAEWFPGREATANVTQVPAGRPEHNMIKSYVRRERPESGEPGGTT